MINDEKKYQYLLEQIHQLNRQNFLSNHDSIEDISNKLSNLEKKIFNKNSDQKILLLYGITGINLFLSVISFVVILLLDNKLNIKKELNPEINIQNDNSVFELKKEEIAIKENFEEIKPIIKKDTIYFCLNEDKIYKIPYTIDIKGKLYEDRFTFVLREDNKEKDCFIKKENL